MNTHILDEAVQHFINEHLNRDVNKIALSKPVFEHVNNSELANQIAAKKKSAHKLPTWFHTDYIYYPPLLSIEQCSSEHTAIYKSKLAKGSSLIDLTAGFGVDSFFFSKEAKKVISCEIDANLAEINAYNAELLGADNIKVLNTNGIAYLESGEDIFDTIYIDPARRNQNNKVFMLKDCNPDVVQYHALLLAKGSRVIIKTAPLLDIIAGLNELENVSEIHILSVKNECKELLWVLDKNADSSAIKVICATLNDQGTKYFSFHTGEQQVSVDYADIHVNGYLYEPDVALLKSGAFNLIGIKYGLNKLHAQSHLYFSEEAKPDFAGRIFKIEKILKVNELKKEKDLQGNVIVRNFPDKAESLAKKYKIKPHQTQFLVFTQDAEGYKVIDAKIIQHY
ncbi:class I SAM-dependent methyltransferase [Pedobacter sp.]|uniref:class I SAM-dependent methyltransferase n=1 Tax=Pedobacter sp. TaxID=1411316 RepID=UPI00396CFACD